MILCPDHTRKKRAHPGGGRPGCRGKLRVKVEVTLDFQAKSWPKLLGAHLDFQRLLTGYVRKHGKRVSSREIYESVCRDQWDLICPECGYSLRRDLQRLNKASHTMGGRRRRKKKAG